MREAQILRQPGSKFRPATSVGRPAALWRRFQPVPSASTGLAGTVWACAGTHRHHTQECYRAQDMRPRPHTGSRRHLHSTAHIIRDIKQGQWPPIRRSTEDEQRRGAAAEGRDSDEAADSVGGSRCQGGGSDSLRA